MFMLKIKFLKNLKKSVVELVILLIDMSKQIINNKANIG